MTQEEALIWFDSLETVGLDFMIGCWQGKELATGHPMEGLLTLSNWYGKEFIDPETVHPLLFLDTQGNLFKVAPYAIILNWIVRISWPQNQSLKPAIISLLKLLKTQKSQARLRMMEYRGKVSATMIYDTLPICDCFRKIDEHKVLGVMDYKALPQPFFFLLERRV